MNPPDDTTFSWIHFSDLHLRAATNWESDTIVRCLIDDLKNLNEKEGFRPDAVFFTGDAVFGQFEKEHISDQFRAFGEFLDVVRHSFAPPLEKSAIYLVPGNHDVDRASVLDSDTAWLRSDERTEDEIIEHLRKSTPMSKQWMRRLEYYRKFLFDYQLIHLSHSDPTLIWADKKEKNGRTIGIAGLNTAWSCATKKEKAQLWMGGRWQIGEIKSRLGEVDLSIALLHHPSNWLTEYEDSKVANRLESAFDILFHGHEHNDFVRQLDNGHLRISAGACYDRSSREKSYSHGSISLGNRTGELRLRTWGDEPPGWVPKNIPSKAPEGIYRIKHLRTSDMGLPVSEKPSQIISVASAPSEDAINQKLARLRRRPFVFQVAHSAVRGGQRVHFEESLSTGKIAWLVADWQMGREGFIATSLNSIGSKEALESVYRIDCGALESVDEIFEEASSQLGVPFVEFAFVVAHLDQATLILEDLPLGLSKSDAARFDLAEKLRVTLQAAPNLRVIVTARQWLTTETEIAPTVLEPLGTDDFLRYLRGHRDGRLLLKRPERLEDALSHTDGLPAAIDQILQKCKVLPLEEILDDHSSPKGETSEKRPRSLELAVERIFAANGDDAKRKLNLFKLLTILKDGETFDALKRAFHGKPFKREDLLELVDEGLVESVPIAPVASSFLPTKVRNVRPEQKDNRLLRVSRSVRDYASTLITEEERSRIFNSVSEALFGAKWYEGNIKLRRAIVLAYRESTIAGPGNELLIAQYLLQSAIRRGNKERTDRYTRLAVGYCSELLTQDRFRDAVIASRAILVLLDEERHHSSWLTCAYVLGRALRMTQKHDESIEILTRLSQNKNIHSKEFLAEIHLNLAWSYNGVGDESTALKHIEVVLQNTKEESGFWFQASALFAEIRLEGGLLNQTLRSLYVRARRNKLNTAADNIAITIAKKCATTEEAIELFDSVINSARDLYNQSRAIIDKADLLRKSGNLSELSGEEQLRLCDAYEYSCSQRISNLVDSCHEALWDFCLLRKFWHGLFRLFRFSSFVWCFTNQAKKETKYIAVLEVAKEDPLKIQGYDLEVEIEYLERRIASKESEN